MGASRFLSVVILTCAGLSGPFAAARSTASPDCPDNTVACDYPITSTDPTGSCSIAPSGGASYDLVSGTFSAYLPQFPFSCCPPSLTASDVYQVVGDASGNPFHFGAALTVHATASIAQCLDVYDVTAGAGVTILESATGKSASVQAFLECFTFGCCGSSTTVDTTLTINLVHPAGEAFTLKVTMFTNHSSGYLSGGGWVFGQLTFVGLPPGAYVTSCQG